MELDHPSSKLEQQTPKPFRVIVVGAGIVGLSLSHALQRANIDHIVLEKHKRSISALGASLVLLPNGARILDQFGVLSKIHDSTSPVDAECQRWPDGSLNTQTRIMRDLNAMFDLPPVVFDRHSCVSHLYENLPDKSFIKTEKQVKHIEHTEEGVRVHLSDGAVEEGDLVVGADGVHSTVRAQMWKHAEACLPNVISDSDKSMFSCEYNAIFGVSPPKDEYCLSQAVVNVTYGHGAAKFLFTQPGVVYWFVVYKAKLNHVSETLTTAQALEAIVHQFKDINFTDKVKLSDLWPTRTRAGLLKLEEGILSQWHAGRIVLVGDAVHKMTADLGLGANTGMEDVVSLCNILHRELSPDRARHPPSHEISSMFAEFQTARYERVKTLVELSGKATRMNTWDNFFGRVFISYLAPYMPQYQLMMLANLLTKAPKLDYVPVQTINEDAKGWKLAEESRGTSLAAWLVSAAVGATTAYVIWSRMG